MDNKQEQDEFFEKADLILGPQLPGKTLGRGRWRRGAGKGRYPNTGVIRYYSSANIHVMFHTPSLNKVFESAEEALLELSKVVKIQNIDQQTKVTVDVISNLSIV